MKPVIGLLLVFSGLGIGYLVLTGKLPSASLSPTTSGSTPTGKTSAGTGYSASGSSVTGI